MKKVFALMVVFAAFAAGCAEKETVPPPAQDQAAPAEEAKDMPADGATETAP
jgi:outer membrane lipoprotein-sorting protein